MCFAFQIETVLFITSLYLLKPVEQIFVSLDVDGVVFYQLKLATLKGVDIIA